MCVASLASSRRRLTLRNMAQAHTPPPLGCVLLGLLNRETMSGYELMHVFETTPLGGFSSSPGAIYPALKRLETAGLIQNQGGGARGARWSTTETGYALLREWVAQPLAADAIEKRLPEVMARFVFIGDILDGDEQVTFMTDLSAAIAARLRALAHAADAFGLSLRPHDRWALEASRMELNALTAWTGRAMAGLGLGGTERDAR